MQTCISFHLAGYTNVPGVVAGDWALMGAIFALGLVGVKGFCPVRAPSFGQFHRKNGQRKCRATARELSPGARSSEKNGYRLRWLTER
jgi:hypothetical protein